MKLRTGMGLATVAAALFVAPAASADTVSLLNLAQPGIESTVLQPAAELPVRGGCPFERTLDEANGGASPCPAGTWPAPGGDWSPRVDVASGDRLQLTFASDQQAVAVVGTSNYPVGLTNPDGVPLPNESLGLFTVQATADPRVWIATVPALDNRARSVFTAIAVTAQESGGTVARNAAFWVQTPRFADESTRCGDLWYSLTQPGYLCEANTTPPGVPNPTPIPAPQPIPVAKLTLTAKIDAKCSTVIATVRGASRLTFGVTLSGHGIARWTRSAPNANSHRLKLALNGAVRKRLRSGGRVTLTVTGPEKSQKASRSLSARACKKLKAKRS